MLRSFYQSLRKGARLKLQDRIIAQERTRLWSEMTPDLLRHNPHGYWKRADRVLILTKMLNKHNTDITGYRMGERCPDCELRGAASSTIYLVGSKNGKYDSHIRRHPWYKYKLSMGCENCHSKGRLIDEKKEARN